MRIVLLLVAVICATLLPNPTDRAFANKGGGKGGSIPAAAAAKADFGKSAARTPGRPRSTRLPYKANPIPEQRTAARARTMAEQIRVKANKNQIRINGTNGRQMVVDVGARRAGL